MTKQELKAKIDKLENGIKSKATPSNLIAPLKAQKSKLEKELEEMEAAEKKAVKTKKVSKVAEKIKAAKKSVAKKTPAKAPAKEERKKDNIARDGDRKSLPAGKRISKTGKVYYEMRANRTDKQTSKKPYLADGGILTDAKKEAILKKKGNIIIFKEVLEPTDEGRKSIAVQRFVKSRKTEAVKLEGSAYDTQWFESLQDLINAVDWSKWENNKYAKGGEVSKKYVVFFTRFNNGKSVPRVVEMYDNESDAKEYVESQKKLGEKGFKIKQAKDMPIYSMINIVDKSKYKELKDLIHSKDKVDAFFDGKDSFYKKDYGWVKPYGYVWENWKLVSAPNETMAKGGAVKKAPMIYEFKAILRDEDDKIIEKKEFKVRATARDSAYNKAYKKYPKPYFVELYNSYSADKMADGGDIYDDMEQDIDFANDKAKKIANSLESLGYKVVKLHEADYDTDAQIDLSEKVNIQVGLEGDLSIVIEKEEGKFTYIDCGKSYATLLIKLSNIDKQYMEKGGKTKRTVKLTLSDKDSYDYTYKQDGATASITFGFGKEPFQYEVKKISKSLEPLKQDILDTFTLQGIKQHEYKGGFSEAIKHLDTSILENADEFAKGGSTKGNWILRRNIGYGTKYKDLTNGDKIRMNLGNGEYYHGTIKGQEILWEDGIKTNLTTSFGGSNANDKEVLRFAKGGKLKIGDIVIIKNPLPDEDPNQLYVVIQEDIEKFSDDEQIDIRVLNEDKKWAYPPIVRVEKKDLEIVYDVESYKKMADGGKTDEDIDLQIEKDMNSAIKKRDEYQSELKKLLDEKSQDSGHIEYLSYEIESLNKLAKKLHDIRLKRLRDKALPKGNPFKKMAYGGNIKSENELKNNNMNYAEGGELNLAVRKMASQKGLTPKKLGADYELIMAQAAVDAFTDANYHDAARKLVSILEKKPEIAVKPDYPSPSDPEFKVKFDAINEKYDSKYWHGDAKTRDFAVKVSQNSGWDGNGIAGAFEYLLRMEGYHRLADNIKKSIELSDSEKIADFAYENDIYATGNSFEDFSRRIKEKSGTNYADEDLQIAYNLLSNVRYEKGGYMAYGGKTKTMKSIKDLTIEQISSMTGVGKSGVERFSDENNLTESDLSNIMQGLGRRMITASDFATAVSGNKDNQYAKEIVDFAKSGKGYRMADGGQVGNSYMMGEEEVYIKDSSLGIDDEVCLFYKKDDSILKCISKNSFDAYVEQGKLKPKMAKGGKVPAHFGSGKNIDVFGYQTENFDICGTAVKEFESAMEIMQNAKESEKESLARCAKYVDGLFGIEKQVVENSGTDDANFYEAVSDIMSASIYNYRAEMSINLFSFVPQHLKEIAVRMEKAEKGGLYALGGMTAGRWYRDKSGEEFKFIGKIDSGENKGKFLFTDGQKSVYKDLEDFEGGKPKETKLFGFFEDGGEMELGGMLIHGFQIGDTILEIYKGYGIVENNNNGVIEVLNPNRGTRFIIDLDESKPTGEKSMGMSKEKQIESAKGYIDYLDNPLPDTLLEKFRAEGKMAKGGKVPSTYIPNEDIKELMVTLNNKSLKLKGSDILDGVYVKNSALKGGSLDYSKQTSDDFKLGEIVWDVDNERYGTIIGIYDGYLSDKYEVRLDTDGMQPTENLRKVGSEGDNGTKEQLKEEIDGYARLVKSYPENNYPKQIEPMLEKGGYMAKGGEVKVGDVYERKGFGKLKITKIDDGKFRKVYFKYDDNDKEFFEGMYGAEGKVANKDWVKVDYKMAKGGVMPKGARSGMKIKDWYIKNYPTDDLGKEINDTMTFRGFWALTGQGNNPYEVLGVHDSVVRERVEEKLSQILGKKQMADGGVTDSFEKKVKDAMKEPNKWHFISEEVDGKDVQLKMFVGTKEVDVQIFKINGIHARMPRNYSGKRDTLKMIMDNFESKMAKGGMTRKGGQPFEVEGRKFFYHKDDGNVYDSNHRLYAGSYSSLELAKKSLEKNFENIKTGNFYKDGGYMAKGGEITREDITILGVPRSKITDKEWESIIRMSKYQKGATFILKDEKGLDVKPQIEYDWYVNEKMSSGGKVKFADKVKSVQESLLKRKKVSPKVQKDYGKTYSKAEAKESAQRIVGSRMAQLKEKMAKKKK